MIWFDGGADDSRGMGPDVEPIIAKYQPNCLFYHNVNRADLRGEARKAERWAIPAGQDFPIPTATAMQTATLRTITSS